MANTSKLYEEAKKRATAVGKLIDGFGQEIFKIPQKIKLLAMEHEDKFRDKIEAIKKSRQQKIQVSSGYVALTRFYCPEYTRWEFQLH